MEGVAWHDAGVDDRAIVDAVLAGDRDAFRLIVERESAPVYRACLRILGRAHDAEEAAQDGFVIAYRSLASFRGDGSLGGWLMRIATREAFRRLRRGSTVELAAAAHVRESRPDADPVATAIDGERQARVRAAVAALAEPYREVVALRFFGELSLNEIAAATGRPLPTVKTQLRRGLDRLRGGLGEELAS